VFVRHEANGSVEKAKNAEMPQHLAASQAWNDLQTFS